MSMKHSSMRTGGTAALAALLCLTGGCLRDRAPSAPPALVAPAESTAVPYGWYDGRWPHERPLPPHERLLPHDSARFGRLANGLRYVIVPNAKPEGRVSLHLDVQAGSLMETDEQRGLAHFVEHMAFNGSRNFAPGTLIPFLQHNGMAFGADANAHTSTAETVYKLDLPTADTATIEKGLLILRDVADGLLILPEEVEKERGVILAEKLARDNRRSRAGKALRDVLYADSRYAFETIGLEDVVRHARPETLRAFYDTWYRPERMVLVAVGAVTPADLATMVERHFADVKARTGAPVMPAPGNVRHEGVHASYDPETGGGVTVSVTAMHTARTEVDSMSLQRRRLAEAVATSAFQKRLLRLASTPGAPVLGGHMAMPVGFEMFETATITMRARGEDWRNALTTAETELRRALEHGFTQDEFENARRVCEGLFTTMRREKANRTNSDIAAEAVACFNADRVFQSTDQTCDLYLNMLSSLTRGEVEEAFRRRWDTGNRMLHLSGMAGVENAPARLVEAWAESTAHAVEAPRDSVATAFPYLAEPTLPALVLHDSSRQLPEGPALRTVRLDNGLTLHMAVTPYEKGRFSLSLFHGDGLDGLDDATYAVARATERTLREEGVGRLSREATRDHLGWRHVKVETDYRDDAFTINASGPGEELDAVTAALWTQYTDPTPTKAGRARAIEGLEAGRDERENTVEGVAPHRIRAFLYGDARRTAPLDGRDVARVPLDAMSDFALARTSTPPRTIVAVGDFDPERLIERMRHLFAMPAPVPASHEAPHEAIRFPAGARRTVEVADPDGKAHLVVAWRHDLEDESDQRALAIRHLTASWLNEVLREEVREAIGASYSPSGRYRHDQERGGFGTYVASIRTDAALVDKVRRAVREAAQGLAKGEVPPGTAARLRAPVLNAITKARDSNTYWQRIIEAEVLRGRPAARHAEAFAKALGTVTDADIAAEARAVFATRSAELAITGKAPATKPGGKPSKAAVSRKIPAGTTTEETAQGVAR